MTSLRRTVEVPYKADDMFELVSDVARYPEFIKWIQRLRVLDESAGPEDGVTKVRAEASVGFLAFTERFTTDVVARRAERLINVSLVRGPFRRLTNTWRFEPVDTGTRIEFFIDFTFKNFVLQSLAAANLDYAVGRIIESFTAEAGRRYGTDVSGA